MFVVETTRNKYSGNVTCLVHSKYTCSNFETFLQEYKMVIYENFSLLFSDTKGFVFNTSPYMRPQVDENLLFEKLVNDEQINFVIQMMKDFDRVVNERDGFEIKIYRE